MGIFKSSFDDNGLRRLQQNLREIDGTNQVPIAEMLSPEFMTKHTGFPSFEAMLEASPFKVDTAEDFKAIPDEEWEAYVRQVTSFDSWVTMQREAGVEWIHRRLLKGLK